MEVVVIGAGVTGVTSAYYLAKAGHTVTVIERNPAPGMEASFANAGLLTPGHAEAWASPAALKKVVRWFWHEDGPVKIRPRLDPAMWGWLFRFLRNCTQTRWQENTAKSLRLANYSLRCLAALREEEGLAFNHQSTGQLMLTRQPGALKGWDEMSRMLRKVGLEMEVTDAGRCIELEPALARTQELSAVKLVGGIHFPGDESGDCLQFTQSLAQLCKEKLGVRFLYEHAVVQVYRHGGAITALGLDGGREVRGDQYVLCAGSQSPLLLRGSGTRLPIYPVKGYSITAPWAEGVGIAPRMALSDLDYKFSVSPLGERLRVGGTAEFAGYDATLSPKRAQAVLRGARRLFPEGPDYERAVSWSGLRPATPDSAPILGACNLNNLLLNTGHGTLGWTHACGSGKIIADLVDGKSPEIALDGLGVSRFA